MVAGSASQVLSLGKIGASLRLGEASMCGVVVAPSPVASIVTVQRECKLQINPVHRFSLPCCSQL